MKKIYKQNIFKNRTKLDTALIWKTIEITKLRYTKLVIRAKYGHGPELKY